GVGLAGAAASGGEAGERGREQRHPRRAVDDLAVEARRQVGAGGRITRLFRSQSPNAPVETRVAEARPVVREPAPQRHERIDRRQNSEPPGEAGLHPWIPLECFEVGRFVWELSEFGAVAEPAEE